MITNIAEIESNLRKISTHEMCNIIKVVISRTTLTEESVILFKLDGKCPDCVKFIVDYANDIICELYCNKCGYYIDSKTLMISYRYRYWLENIIYKTLSHHIITLALDYSLLQELYISAKEYVRSENNAKL